jgi:ribosomal protein S18 acetylase RimI-like enzyme
MTGTIRSAAPADAGALTRLFVAAGDAHAPLAIAGIAGSLARGQLLVLDIGTEVLGGAAFVTFECPDERHVHALIQYLIVHPALVGTGAEERLITAVLAICEASGCSDLDLSVRAS